ncbi:MAG: outer membrane lipoprotein-sorting protein [Pseudobdellovibrionaceae bacterium]
MLNQKFPFLKQILVKKIRIGFLIFCFGGSWLMTSMAEADFAVDLLRASDRGRGGLEGGSTWESQVETHEDGEVLSREFLIKAKKTDALAEALSPARNKGELYLFNDRNLWFFKPSLKKPVAISSRQKLSGQAANGDIASTNYARDYNPTLEKTEVINGEKVHILLLKAKADNLTYDQIRYWIGDKSKRAIKAEFLTLEGKVFKTAILEYKNKLKINNEEIDFVSRLEITDALNPKNKSILIYKNPKVGDHSQKIFNINNLSR